MKQFPSDTSDKAMARTSDTKWETNVDDHRIAANSGGKRVDDQSGGAFLENKQ